MHISSVEDGGERYPPPRKPRFERWKERVEAAGFSIHWRPTGDASTLYLPGHEGDFAEKKQWIGAAKVEAERIEQGLDPRPIEDRSFPSSHLRAEARALAPWLTGGKYEKNPIPLAFVYPRAPRGKELGGHDLAVEFFLEEAELDEDPGIATELVDGLELEATVVDSHFAFHHPSFWDTPEGREKSLSALREEAKTGAFITLGEVPMIPLRINPRFVVDQGLKSDGITRKLRAIINLSHLGKLLSVNGHISLEDLHNLKLTSGIKYARCIGILARIAVKVIQLKRDMKNAFRQVPVCPFDWWLQCCISPRGCEVDTRVVMGARSSVHKFQRLHEAIARAYRRPIARIDAQHPPTDPDVTSIMASRKRKLGVMQGERISTTHVYVDDACHGTANDPIQLKSSVLQFASGEVVDRGRVHEAIIDHTYKRSKMEMSEDKNEFTDKEMEALGVEVDPPKQAVRYPPRKVGALEDGIREALATPDGGTIPRKKIETLIGKEKWMAHVALEINHLLASGYAVAKCGAPHVGLGAHFRTDQQALLNALRAGLPDTPLVPASRFPQVNDPTHCLVFQDASTSTGFGGWFIWQGTLFHVEEEWPQCVLAAFKDGRWSISPAEAWIEVVMLVLAQQHAPDAAAVTDFTDNEATRAAANNGRSGSEAMDPLARELAALASHPGRIVRTLRVTTGENKLADELSRGIAAAQKVAAQLNLKHRRLKVPAELWALLPGF